MRYVLDSNVAIKWLLVEEIIVSRTRYLIVGGYGIPDTSPAFPVILLLGSTVMVGLPVGSI